MRRWWYLARFFFVAPPMPLLMIGAFAVATVVAIVSVIIDPARASSALTPVLLLQLFACASGFDVPARRGHYDLLLTHGEPRRRVIAAHWGGSAAPGILCWLLIAVVRYAISSGSGRTLLLNVGTVTAMILVSTIPWAITVRLPRFSGAIGWLLTAVTLSLARPDMVAVQAGAPIHGATEWLVTTCAVLVYPLLLVGRDLHGRDLLVVVPGVMFAIAAVSIASWSIDRRDIPLEAAQ